MPGSEPDVLAALRFAVDAHGAQRRKDGRTPYAVHPVAVLRRLSADLGVTDPATLCAGVLHDVLEDTPTTPGALEEAFGPEVLALVLSLTLPPHAHGESVDPEEKTRHLLEGVRAMPWKAVLVKVCDRWDNLTDMAHAPWGAAKRRTFLEQSRRLFAAIDDRRRASPEPPALQETLARALAGARAALEAAGATTG